MAVEVHKPAKTRSFALACAAGITKKELDTRDSNGRTVLFYAARNGKTQVVKNLLYAGSDSNMADVEGSTPLHEAIERCHLDVVKTLLKCGRTDVNAKNRHGQTAIMKCVLYDDVESLKILHKAGGKLNEVDYTGKSAFLICLAEGREKTAQYLIKNGCDVNVVDKLGQSALFLALSSSHASSAENIRRLLKAGYNLDKDRAWLAKAGISTESFQQKNVFQRLMERLTQNNRRRRHSEGFVGRSSSQVNHGISHAHPRFRFRNNSAIL